jgi:hypothetical protein
VKPTHIKAYIQSKTYEFPLTTQIARDFMAIPVTLAPSGVFIVSPAINIKETDTNYKWERTICIMFTVVGTLSKE